ncbi:MAG: NAD(P)-dependent oxidoreductase [Rhodospirillales bacterium]|nr:NAD(P)-dependent oxidoreductase [Rhodospirillales bacterium]
MSMTPMSQIKTLLQGERILLVGGAGFIGHNLALDLRTLGVEVMVADNLMINSLIDVLYSTKISPVQRALYLNFLIDRFDLMREANVEFRNVDARSMVDLGRAFDEFQPTKVVHLSAIASAVDAGKDPGLCFDLQLNTLRNILELCRPAASKVNQVMELSSSTVYGDFEGDSVDENTRPRPHGIYSNTKYMGERLIRTYAHQHNLGITIIRPSALYGERCVSRRVSQVFIENALSGKPLLLEGGGDGKLDFTYIKDLINGMIRTLAYYKERGSTQTFNITFGNARSIAELAGVIRQVVPDAILEERPRALDKPIRGTLSIERASREIGFKPEWPLETGYLQYCQWYKREWERAERMAARGL